MKYEFIHNGETQLILTPKDDLEKKLFERIFAAEVEVKKDLATDSVTISTKKKDQNKG
jgi:hypothetical protein